jgi:hypothetical protein
MHIAAKKQRISVPLSDDEDEDDDGAASIKSASQRLSRFRKSPVKKGGKGSLRSLVTRLHVCLHPQAAHALGHQMTTTSSSPTRTTHRVQDPPDLRRGRLDEMTPRNLLTLPTPTSLQRKLPSRRKLLRRGQPQSRLQVARGAAARSSRRLNSVLRTTRTRRRIKRILSSSL